MGGVEVSGRSGHGRCGGVGWEWAREVWRCQVGVDMGDTVGRG